MLIVFFNLSHENVFLINFYEAQFDSNITIYSMAVVIPNSYQRKHLFLGKLESDNGFLSSVKHKFCLIVLLPTHECFGIKDFSQICIVDILG